MSADGSDEDELVAEYENVTAADIIEEAEPVAAADDADETGDEDGAVAGSFAPDVEVTPQSPTPENTLFVALGAYLTVLALAETVVGLDLQLVAGVTVAVAVVSVLCYGVLVRTTPET